MTREQAYNRIDAIIAKHEIDDEYVTITNSMDYDALRMAREFLEYEPFEDCISREDALLCLTGRDLPENRNEYIGIVNERLKGLPSIQPIRHKGEWKYCYGGMECSLCHCREYGRSDFCPNCGADMRESEDNNE